MVACPFIHKSPSDGAIALARQMPHCALMENIFDKHHSFPMWDIVTTSQPILQCNLHNMGMISRPKKNLKVCSDADGDQTQRS